MRVFVTGASGWIGTAAVSELIDAGHEVSALARTDEKAAQLEQKSREREEQQRAKEEAERQAWTKLRPKVQRARLSCCIRCRLHNSTLSVPRQRKRESSRNYGANFRALHLCQPPLRFFFDMFVASYLPALWQCTYQQKRQTTFSACTPPGWEPRLSKLRECP